MRSPPDTGAGMQNLFRKDTFLVRYIPRNRARTPAPALWYMSSVTAWFILGTVSFVDRAKLAISSVVYPSEIATFVFLETSCQTLDST
jgi:hypothetical protein